MRRPSILAAIVLFLAATIFAGDTLPLKRQVVTEDLSGIWEAHGVENGEPYAAVVTIQKHHAGYVAQWSSGPGSNTLANMVREGDSVVVSWSTNGRPGLSLFKVGPCGKAMTGKWLALPDNHWHAESLKYVAPLPVKRKVEGV